MLTGKLTAGNVIAPITGGKLDGAEISFVAGGTKYSGRVDGDVIEGTARAGSTESKWRAARIAK
jgi:hypothetical protein